MDEARLTREARRQLEFLSRDAKFYDAYQETLREVFCDEPLSSFRCPTPLKDLQNPQVWLAHVDAPHQLMFVIDRGTLLIQPIESTGTTQAALQTLM